MKKYPAYKVSGIEWTKVIPTHWKMMKLGRIGRFSASGIDKKSDSNEIPVRMVNYTDVYGNHSLEILSSDGLMETTTIMEKIVEHSLKQGDILFTPSSETEEDIGVSAVITKNLDKTVYSYHLIRLRPYIRFELSLRFRKYFCNTHEVLSQFSRLCKGTTRQILGRDDFKCIQVVLPPASEQNTIANFLDKKINQIDDLIVKKERMIELLKEERTAIINQAVTKGLDPDVETKDSGIEWIGKMPKHWEIKRLKYVADKVQTGITPPSESAEYYDGGNIDWYTPGDFQKSIQLKNSFRKINKLAIEKGVARIFPPRSVLLIGIGATLGKVGIIEEPSSSNQQINAIIFSDKFNPFFGVYYLQAITSTVISLSNASTLAILNQTQMKDILVLVPPLEEQGKIMRYIQAVELKHSEIVSKEQRQIDLLKEYRTALISEVVTGKIDVRDEVNA